MMYNVEKTIIFCEENDIKHENMSFSKNCFDTINSDVQISNSIMKTTSMVNCSQQSLAHPILMKEKSL